VRRRVLYFSPSTYSFPDALGPRSAAFNAGTVLAISAVEDGISANPKRDLERRGQASKDLRFIIECLKEIGTTWTTAHTSAGVLEARPALFLGYLVTRPHADKPAPYRYLVEDGRMLDINVRRSVSLLSYRSSSSAH